MDDGRSHPVGDDSAPTDDRQPRLPRYRLPQRVPGCDQVPRQIAPIRMDWGPAGAAAVGADADFAVVVDILSFSTAVSVALDRGTEVYPYRWRDASAARFAHQQDAVLAGERSETRLEDASRAGVPGVSLSPASIRAAPAVRRLVLPSPNGSALSAQLAEGSATVLTAAFRNRAAVAEWLAARRNCHGGTPVIAIIAAGERWPDGSPRPAVEDLWGAGALIAALEALGFTGLSPEAATASAALMAVCEHLGEELDATVSGCELASRGFGDDVTLAAELDVSTTAPLLCGGRYLDAATTKIPQRLQFPANSAENSKR